MSKTMSSDILWQPNGIMGLSLVSDFDTSQSMYIGDFFTNIFNEKMTAKSIDVLAKSRYKEISVPGVIFYNKERYGETLDEGFIENLIKNEYSMCPYDKNSEIGAISEYSLILQSIELNKTKYFVVNGKSIYSFILGGDIVLFVVNPNLSLFLEEELKTKKEYKEYVRFFRSNEKTRKSYIEGIEQRRILFFEKMKTFFDLFVESFLENGCSCPCLNRFLTTEDFVMVGKKEDSVVWRKEKLCPYYPIQEIDDSIKEIEKFNFYDWYTREELDIIAAEKREYERKKTIVKNRMAYLEQLLREKKYTWTIISTREPKFEDNPYEYRLWMNAQSSDNANAAWCTEKDFIDWINMEGKIPFYRAIVSYYSKILESISNEEYKFVEYRKKNKEEKVTYYSNNEVVGVFQKGKKNTILTIEEIKEKIVSINGSIPKYTMDDFEKDLANFYKGDETLYKF